MDMKELYREYDEEDNLIKLECSKCHEIKTVDYFFKNRSKRFYNNSSYIATKWQDFLTNEYTDNLGKVYNNKLPDIDNDICPF